MLIFLLAQSGLAKTVKLGWKKMANVKSYHFQVAPEKTFGNPVIDKTTNKNSLGVDLPAGTFYLRVQGIYPGGGRGEWSQPFKLTVTASLEKDRDVQRVSLDEAADPISVSWNEDSQATSYKVVVEKNGKDLSSDEVSVPTFSLRPDGVGRYRVKVRSGVDGSYGPENVVRTILVLDPPKISAESAFVEAQQAVSAESLNESPDELPPPRPSARGASLARPAVVVSEPPEVQKKWFVDVGPVFSSSFVGANGTKYNVFFGILEPYQEKVDFRIFYDGNFNTASQGSTLESEVGAAVDFFFDDRLTPHSFFITLDLGYGGGNRDYDAFLIMGGGVGYQFYRTQKMSFEVQFHFSELLSANGNFTSNPSWQTLRIGTHF